MDKKIENLTIHKLTNNIYATLGEDFAPKESIQKGLEEAMERNQIRTELFFRKAQSALIQKGNPFPCFNMVCPENIHDTNSCKKELICWDCLFQMLDPPPNSINYSINNEKMPSHQEALDLLVSHNLLKDETWERELETIYFRDKKKPKTQYDRGQEEIKGVTMDQFRGIILNFLEEFFNEHTTIVGEYQFPPIAEDFDFKDEEDREIFAQNICVGIEKVMGIFPNIKPLR